MVLITLKMQEIALLRVEFQKPFQGTQCLQECFYLYPPNSGNCISESRTAVFEMVEHVASSPIEIYCTPKEQCWTRVPAFS